MDLELVGGVSAIILIVSLVQLAKRAGLAGRWAGVLAIVIGMLISAGHHYLAETTIWQTLIVGLALGLGAAGAWSTGKAVWGQDRDRGRYHV